MTALNTADIPNQIDTLERLHAWSGLALAYLNPTKAIVETAGENPERVVQTFILKADDGTDRLVIRTALELDPAWLSDDTNALWLSAQDFENVALPANFTNA